MVFKTIFLIVLIFTNFLAVSQTIEWQKLLGGSKEDEAFSIVQSGDGGYVVAGYSYSDDGDIAKHHKSTDYDNSDFWIVKIDFAGNIEWQKTPGGTKDEIAFSVVSTNDGGYAVAGYSYSNDGDVSGNHGDADFWVVKLDSEGKIQWQKSLGGSKEEYAYSIVQTIDGGYVVAGYTDSNDGDVSGNHGNADSWIVKLDSKGNIIWQKTLGGTGDDYAYSIIQTTDGGYIFAGWSYSNNGDVARNHGESDYWIVKLDSKGNFSWQKLLGGSGEDQAYSIIQTVDGSYVIAGYSYSDDGDVTGNHGDSDYWIVKLDSAGNILWQKSLGGSGEDDAFSIVNTNDGGYIVGGNSNSNDGDVFGNHGNADCWIVKLDTSGNFQRQKSVGGIDDDFANSVIQTKDKESVIAGYSYSDQGDADFWIVKISK